MPATKSYVGQMMNRNRAQAIIDFDDHIFSSRRRGLKSSNREKYADEPKACLSENSLGFKLSQAMVWLKEIFPEGVGATDFPCDKQIKNKYSALKRAFKEASEDI